MGSPMWRITLWPKYRIISANRSIKAPHLGEGDNSSNRIPSPRRRHRQRYARKARLGAADDGSSTGHLKDLGRTRVRQAT